MNELIILKNIDVPDFIVEPILANSSYEQIRNFLGNKRSEFDSWFGNLIGKTIQSNDSWVNYTVYRSGTVNHFPWHNEQGVGGSGLKMHGSYASIIWISGDTDVGGDLSVLIRDQLQKIAFEPGTVLIFPIDTFHQVEFYQGSNPRISLNFTFEEV
jgi:hypothetical protein